MPSRREPNPWLVRFLQVGLSALGLGLWELFARGDKTLQFFVSRPSRIILRAWQWIGSGGTIYRDMSETLVETAAGFALGVGLGLALALVCYYSPLIFRLMEPFLNVANAMPRVVFGPLFILWFGLGLTSKVVLAASLVLFIVFFATLSGLHEVDQHVLIKVRLMGANQWDVLVHVLLPSGLVWVFSSLRSSMGFALAGAVVGEYIGSSRGMGYRIALAEGNLDATGIFAGLLLLAVTVLIMNTLLEHAERRLTPWRSAS